ncbi:MULTISPECIES: M48 family metalloprotease [Chitinophagaceae]|uniref:M48 family metalloprotease n=1 Tax=Chitinophagaceae TaxID=563835 RepID=UPI00195C3042|nr:MULTISPECIES: M48 family metalloprotease [Chitinophagaceae]
MKQKPRHMKTICLAALIAAVPLVFENCARNPVTGKRQVAFISEEQEIAMGKEADPQIIAQYGLYENQALQAFINEKGKQMAAVSHRPGLNYQFRIVDSDILNAFAVPGGYVYFTRGIMAAFNNEAEFAGVLGHEIGHITARHTVSQQSKQILGQIGLIGGMILSPTVAQMGEQAMQGLSLLFLKFGRDAERESDQLGVEYSTKIGYDATEMAGFFNTLKRQSQASGAEELPNFLSTHPDPGERNATVAQLAREWKAKTPGTNYKVGRNEYLRRIDGIIYGEDPKGGFMEGGVFYHPEMKFQLAAPSGWRYANSPQQVQWGEPNGRAAMILLLAPGNNLQQAAQTALQQYNLKPLESREVSVNGLPAIAVVADQQAQQQQQQTQQAAGVRTLNYFIQYGGAVYHLVGLSSAANFANYSALFQSTMQGFRQLTDASKLNKQPQRVRIKTAASGMTLQAALQQHRVPQARMEETAILNGMALTDRLDAGMMYKVIE